MMTSKQQFFTFILVGILNTLFGYSCYACFIFLGLSYPLALLGSMVLGLIFNFNTTGKIVFQNTNNSLIYKFLSVNLFVYFFNMGIISLLKFILSNLYFAGFIAILPSAILGFLLNKNWVFRYNQVSAK